MTYNPSPNDGSPVIVGCDPSMGHCGIAVACPAAGLEHFVRDSFVVKPPGAASDCRRVASVAEGVRRVVREWNVHSIFVETPTSLYVKRGRSLDALKVLLAIGGIYAASGYLGVPVYGVTVQDWKGAGSHDKDHSVALVKAIWPAYKERDVKHDEAEAVLLCLSAVQPMEVRMAFGLMKLNCPMSRILGVIKNEWSWGPREVKRIEKLANQNRLSGSASSKKGRRG